MSHNQYAQKVYQGLDKVAKAFLIKLFAGDQLTAEEKKVTAIADGFLQKLDVMAQGKPDEAEKAAAWNHLLLKAAKQFAPEVLGNRLRQGKAIEFSVMMEECEDNKGERANTVREAITKLLRRTYKMQAELYSPDPVTIERCDAFKEEAMLKTREFMLSELGKEFIDAVDNFKRQRDLRVKSSGYKKNYADLPALLKRVEATPLHNSHPADVATVMYLCEIQEQLDLANAMGMEETQNWRQINLSTLSRISKAWGIQKPGEDKYEEQNSHTSPASVGPLPAGDARISGLRSHVRKRLSDIIHGSDNEGPDHKRSR